MVIMIVEDKSRAQERLLRSEHKISALTDEEVFNLVFSFYEKDRDITKKVLKGAFEESDILWAQDRRSAVWYDPDTENNFVFLVI